MKYTEKIGEVETIYEGTPSEIMELYIKMNPEEPGIDLKDLIAEDIKAKEHYDNMKYFRLTPSGICEADVDKIENEIVKRVSLALSQI